MATREIDGDARLDGDIEVTGNFFNGVATPQGRLHFHDGTSGLLFASKTGINGSAQTLIPDGGGDVVKGVEIIGVASNGVPQTTPINIFVANNSNADVTADAGANSLRFAVSIAGALTVVRQAGSSTWECTLMCVWK